MSLSQAALSIVNAGICGGFVPDENRHLRRFPFLFLVDVSGSTGLGSSPDINKINQAVPELLAALRTPPAASELAMQVDAIDVCVVTYSDAPQLEIDWCVATALPDVRPFAPLEGTATGRALEFSIDLIGKQHKNYRSQNINAYGMAHIIHISDGAPTDMPIGSARWKEISQRLKVLRGAHQVEGKQLAQILHYVTPNGCDLRQRTACMQDETGQLITGQQALARLTGPETVYEVASGVGSLSSLVKLITCTISGISQSFDTYKVAREEAVKSDGTINPTTLLP